MSGEGEVGDGASGQTSARGSACSKEWATAELLDTVEWREVDGGRGYSGEVAAAASAMVGERRGRGDGGEWGCPEARGRVEGFVQRIHGRGGKQVAPWRARARRRHLSACSGESRQLTGAGQHSAGPPGGLPGKSFCFLFSLFLFISVLCFEIVKILFDLKKS